MEAGREGVVDPLAADLSDAAHLSEVTDFIPVQRCFSARALRNSCIPRATTQCCRRRRRHIYIYTHTRALRHAHTHIRTTTDNHDHTHVSVNSGNDQKRPGGLSGCPHTLRPSALRLTGTISVFGTGCRLTDTGKLRQRIFQSPSCYTFWGSVDVRLFGGLAESIFLSNSFAGYVCEGLMTMLTTLNPSRVRPD